MAWSTVGKEQCQCRLDVRKYSFSQRIIDESNKLPTNFVNVTVLAFLEIIPTKNMPLISLILGIFSGVGGVYFRNLVSRFGTVAD